MTAVSILCFVWILFCGINSGSTQSSNVRAVAQNVIALEGQQVDLRCITSLTNVLRWTFNGVNLVDERENLIQFKPVGLNHSLIILNAKVEHSGEYNCHIVGTDVNLKATIVLTVQTVGCSSSIAGGLIWDGQRVGSTSLQRCSYLHENFHSAVFISRVCNNRGQWKDVDFSSCTMHLYSNPIIVAQRQVLSNSESDIDGFRDEVFRFIGTLNYELIDYYTVTLPNDATKETVSIAVISSVYRPDEYESSGDEDDPGPLSRNQLTIDNATTVTQFIPDYQCSCDRNARPTSVKQICVGPGVSPCIKTDRGYRCNHPIYAGNGRRCGLDSDSDGFPDVQLDCRDESCAQDICPNVYSVTADGQQDCFACGKYDQCNPRGSIPGFDSDVPVVKENFTGCPSEVDHRWFILWPQTAAGSVATQKCNGVDLVGLVTRQCREDSTWGNISGIQDCYSIEFSTLLGSTIDLRNFYFGDVDYDVYDQTQSHTLLDSLSVSKELRSLTNSSNPITPNDLNVANDILRTIISVEGYNEDYDYHSVVEDLSSVISNLLNASNRVSYDEFYSYHNSTDDHEEEDNEAELLLENIDNFASVFRSLLINSFSLHQQSSQNFKFSHRNFNISFELPDLESSGGIEFNVEKSQVYIPYTSIKHQMDTEGIQVPVVNYVAGNLASVLPARSLINKTVLEDQVISSQISSQPISLPPDGYIKFTFKLDNPIDGQPKCVFWNFTLDVGNQTGGWSEEGVILDVENTNSTTITCVTNHLTSFAVLVDSSETISKISSSEARALSIVSYIGCGVSIICLLATIIIILLFRNSAFKATHNMIHLNLSIALLLGLVVFVSGIETANDSKAGCISVTVLLHYLFLAAFCWMLCEAIIIYILLVKVFYNGFFKTLPFYIVLGWGLPIPIVAVTAGLSYDHYDDDDDICWLPSERGIMWAFIAPVIAIIICNTIILVLAIYTICKTTRKKVENHQMTKFEMGKKLVWAAVVLLPILGSTWIIGMISVNKDYTAFAWIFTILNSFQGMFIFIFYILRNKQLRDVIKTYFGIQTKNAARSSTTKLTSQSTKASISQTVLISNNQSSRNEAHLNHCQSTIKISDEDHSSHVKFTISTKSETPSSELEIYSTEEQSAV